MEHTVARVGAVLGVAACLAFTIACGGGGGSGGGPSAAYTEGVASYKTAYDKSDAWEDWMIANHARYGWAFKVSSAKPATVNLCFRYAAGTTYTVDWVDEADHMEALAVLVESAYSGYDFNFVFEGCAADSYGNVTAGIPVNCSYAQGRNVYLYHETIFNHEFGHVMGLPHHYDSMADMGEGSHMPPGDIKCIMDRTSVLFCSACRMALGIPLDAGDPDAVQNAMDEINAHVVGH